MSDRHKLYAAVYVIFRQDGNVLFGRRANTGYMDGRLQLPSGHVEKNENLYEAAAREALEEVGVVVTEDNLKLVSVNHRYEDSGIRDYIDFYFEASKWSGELRNTEPDKCTELIWIADADIQANHEIVDYVRLNFQDMKLNNTFKTDHRNDT